jgi:two-component system cell cycle sensor histidine kinase/response regulator CckA
MLAAVSQFCIFGESPAANSPESVLFSAKTVLDAILSVISLILAVVLWRARITQPGSLRLVFVWMAVLVAVCGVGGLCLLAVGARGGFWGPAQLVAMSFAFGLVLATLWHLRFQAAKGKFVPEAELARLKLLDAALDACSDGVMIAQADDPDSSLQIVYANPAFEVLTGYSSDEAVGESPSFLADESEPESYAVMRAALRSAEPSRVEVPSRRKDGSRVWTEWQVVQVAGETGQHTHRIAVLRDTTERQQAEQALRESEGRFRDLFENAADALFLLDAVGRIVDANFEACRTLGYTRTELTGRAFGEIEAGTPPTGSAIHSVEETLTSAATYRRKDGSTFPVEVRFAAIRAGGRLQLALVRDVTRRRRAEQALRDREELLRNIIATIPCGVFWKDRNSVYLGCNQQVARDIGVAGPERLIGRTDQALGCVEAAVYKESDQQVMATGHPIINVEEMQTRRNGVRATLLTSKVPLRDSSGRVVGVLGVYQDITDRKRLEAQFLQAQKMEAVGRLAGGIAHDFNNLLTVIRGNADLILAPRASSPDPRVLIDDLRLAADRAAGLVRQLLMFSRRQPSNPEVLDLNFVVVGLVGLLRRMLGERVVVEAALAPNPITTRVDHSHIEQVLMNFAVNARDAMPDGGTLTIGTSLVVEGGKPDCSHVQYARLTVSDTGCGMTEEVKSRLFEPFFTTKGPDKGSGLGLATVFGIIEQADGHIEVESELGAGATFRVDLPWCDGPAVNPLDAPPLSATLPPCARPGDCVLLVEDEDAVRNLARIVLEGQGYLVTEAPDGETALTLIEPGRRFDVLVTDLTMPGIDGRELALQLRRVSPDLRVVFMSGYVPETGHLEVVADASFLPKPFTPADLVRAVNKALARQGVNAASPPEQLAITGTAQGAA